MNNPTIQLRHDDALDSLRAMSDESFDAMLTDPPYHLTTGKKGGSGPASVNLDNPYGLARVTTGFMGMTWDDGDIAHKPELWAEALRVLKPGAFGLVFGGTRTWYRLAVALEDAGFEIRDTLMWLYGTGFPKSHNVGKATNHSGWEGYGTALKPAWEAVLLVRKPSPLTYAENALEHGCGALNIDGGRIGAFNRDIGRWPANIALDEATAEMLDQQTGTRTSGANPTRRGNPKSHNAYGEFKGQEDCEAARDADSGGASRFFYVAKPARSERDAGLKGKNEHPTVKPIKLTEWLATLLLPPEREEPRKLLVPFAGVASEAIGAVQAGWEEVTAIEREDEYIQTARQRVSHWTDASIEVVLGEPEAVIEEAKAA